MTNIHNKLKPLSFFEKTTQCKSSETDTNEQIAQNENMIYSQQYDLFFENYVSKSRYIESLYREEHDLRSNYEIANTAGVFYDKTSGMFFENEQEAKKHYEQKTYEEKSAYITSSDIAEADIERKFPSRLFENIKYLFDRIKSKIFSNDRGEQ